eukprot:69876-Prorocentrum_minimum.AAC.5
MARAISRLCPSLRKSTSSQIPSRNSFASQRSLRAGKSNSVAPTAASMSARSARRLRRRPARCTLMAACCPSGRVARWTWASEAEATGSSSMWVKTTSTPPCLRNASLRTRRTWLNDCAGARSCRSASCWVYCHGRTLRAAINCAALMYTPPLSLHML